MADDQAKFDVKIGLQVEGGDSAAKSIAALTRQISNLEKDGAKLRGFANAIGGVFGSQKDAYQAAARLKTQREQAAALKPVVESVRNALKGMPPDLASALGIDAKSVTAAGKSVAAFDAFAKRLNAARSRLIESAGDAVAKQSELTGQRQALINESRAVQRLQDRINREAVAAGKATEQQKLQVAMDGAQKRIEVAKKAAVQSADAEVNAARQRLGGALRQVLSQASRDPMGGAQRPTRRELEGRSGLPIADRRAGTAPAAVPVPRIAAAGGGDGGAPSALRDLAAAAKEAASSLRLLAKSSTATGKNQELVATRMMREMRSGFQKEYALLHRAERRNEAQQFPKTQYAQGGASAGPTAAAGAYNQLARAAGSAGRNIGGVVQQGDAITGQIKNVLGMAFGYQAIQAVASQLQQVFGHLSGGVMQFNSMLEQATVGFTTLFDNQRKQAEATNEIMGKQVVGVDYLTMGYKTADEAARGTIETIRQFANVTPFRFAELQESTIRMRAFGFDMSEILRENSEATDKFSGGIVAVGNAVAALGGGADAFRRITYALGQMKQAGRVYQNDMMQLANAGIGGYKYIAEALQKEITTDGKGTQDKVIKGQEVLYQQLQSNAIETVRRLTTSGRISGEVASRAILAGLERDFGGGMVAQSKTFAGAFSTVADMSQSLVADAFKPLYNVIRDTTYEFSQFLQQPQVLQAARDFGSFMKGLLRDLRPMGALLSSIAGKVQKDFAGVISRFTAQSGNLRTSLGGTFGAFIIGIREIIKLLDNDYARSVIAAGVIAKLAFSFAATNPFLTSLGLAISAVGALKFAINENLFGIGSAFDTIVARLEPLIGKIRDQLLPVLTRVGETILGGLIAGLSAAIVAMEPALIAITDTLSMMSDLLIGMEGPLHAIGFLIGASLASKLILGAINLLSTAMLRVATNLDTVTAAANRAHTSMSKLQALGSIGLGIGIAGTMATQGAEQAGMIGPETAQALQAVFSIINAIAMIALVAGPVIKFVSSIAKAFMNIGRILGPIISIVGKIVVALGTLVAGFLGVSTGVGIAIVAIAGLVAAIAAFFALNGGGDDKDKPNPEDRYDYRKGTVLENSGFYKDTYQERALLDFRKGERESQFPRIIKAAKNEMKDLTNYQKLLINQQNAANNAQAKYNGLLNIAKQRVQDALQVLQKVAESVLEDIMNPEFESPYKRDQGEMVSYERMLELEQEMSFLTFENAQGITRSFDEYKDILDSILPLTEDEVNSGEISLKMVNERLKIEKERRKEQERIKALAEAEYDIGLATLQQYDESVDPLQRAVNLRQAQAKYEEDINGLRMQGLEDLVDQATASGDWAKLTAATKKRLEEFKNGQQLILDEMKNMFEDYNRDIAQILEDPTMSDAAKKTAIEKRMDQLKIDLEQKFGITMDMMDAKVIEMNAHMQLVMDAANMKGVDMNVTFADSLIDNLESQGFKALINYLLAKYKQVVDLMAMIKRAAADAANLANEDNQVAALKSKYIGYVNKAVSALYKRGEASETINQVKAFTKSLSTANSVAELQNMWNDVISKFLSGIGLKPADIGFARGGIMPANKLAIVGEKGPELVLPQSRGLVLNNSISSRLLGMLTGNGGGGSGHNVTINVNNPVVRSENDIRRLAQEISRVQASQFRTEGGRLY